MNAITTVSAVSEKRMRTVSQIRRLLSPPPELQAPWDISSEARERWQDLDLAVQDVGLPTDIHTDLGPVDATKPIGPGNVQWVNLHQHNALIVSRKRFRRTQTRRAEIKTTRRAERAGKVSFREVAWALSNPTQRMMELISLSIVAGLKEYIGEVSRAPEADGQKGITADPEYTSLYRLWYRLLHTSDKPAKRSGALRGVVCDRWRRFENFFADMKAMGPRPRYGRLAVLRKENEIGPKNVKWAKAKGKS